MNDRRRSPRPKHTALVYLQAVVGQGANQPAGIWLVRRGLPYWLVALIGAGIILVVALESAQRWDSERKLDSLVALTCAGSLLAGGLWAWWRQRRQPVEGQFLDGEGLWEISPWHIRHRDLDEATMVNLRQKGSTVQIELGWPSGPPVLLGTGEAAQADKIRRWLQAVHQVRQLAKAGQLSAEDAGLLARPGGRGILAARLLGWPAALEPAARPAKVGRLWLAPDPVFATIGGGVLALGLGLLFTAHFGKTLHERYREDLAFRSVLTDSGPEPADRYLQQFPQGPRATAVAKIREERVWARALRTARIKAGATEALRAYLRDYPQGSHRDEARKAMDDSEYLGATRAPNPGARLRPLRLYLSDATHERHRAEAEAKFAADFALVLQPLQARRNASGSHELLDALIHQFALARDRPRPDVPISLRGRVWLIPEAGTREADIEQRYRESPDFRINPEIADSAPAFEASNLAGREQAIVKRLNEAVAEALASDYLRFVITETVAESPVTLRYAIFPSGRLIRYIQADIPMDSYRPFQRRPRWLRSYEMDWKVTVQGKAGPVGPLEFRSSHGRTLELDSTRNDPTWAPYAVVLQSDCYDFADQLLDAVGLPKPKRPNRFTFKEATE